MKFSTVLGTASGKNSRAMSPNFVRILLVVVMRTVSIGGKFELKSEVRGRLYRIVQRKVLYPKPGRPICMAAAIIVRLGKEPFCDKELYVFLKLCAC